MSIKIGDKVRFLNAVGGGVVSRVDKNTGVVYVEDEDGFEIPALERECVLVGVVRPQVDTAMKDFFSKPIPSTNKSEDPQFKVRIDEAPLFETKYGDQLKVLLAFFPVDIKQLQTTSYDCYIVNDSNYFLVYNLAIGSSNAQKSISFGIIEPNTQEQVGELIKTELNDWSHINLQLIPFKNEKSYAKQPVVDASLNINPVKFYKLHSFTANDYFDEPAMIVDVTEIQEDALPVIVAASSIKEAMYADSSAKKQDPKKSLASVNSNEKLVVDLHINMLLDSTLGMSNGDILKFQVDKFHQVLAQNRSFRGKKIVFIHGKGEGVLRAELEKQLRTRYKTYYFQDASFREYGFGATMVTIK